MSDGKIDEAIQGLVALLAHTSQSLMVHSFEVSSRDLAGAGLCSASGRPSSSRFPMRDEPVAFVDNNAPPDDYLERLEVDEDLDDTGRWRAFGFAWGFKRRRCSDIREDMDRELRRLRELCHTQDLRAREQSHHAVSLFDECKNLQAQLAETQRALDDARWEHARDHAIVCMLSFPEVPGVCRIDEALRMLYPAEAERMIAAREAERS